MGPRDSPRKCAEMGVEPLLFETRIGPSRRGWKTLERDLWARAGLELNAGILVRAPSEPGGWELLQGAEAGPWRSEPGLSTTKTDVERPHL